MTDLTDLLNQTPEPSSAPSTLNDTIKTQALTWTDQTLEEIVAGMREQSSRWNLNQRTGSKQRVTSKQIPKTNFLKKLTL